MLHWSSSKLHSLREAMRLSLDLRKRCRDVVSAKGVPGEIATDVKSPNSASLVQRCNQRDACRATCIYLALSARQNTNQGLKETHAYYISVPQPAPSRASGPNSAQTCRMCTSWQRQPRNTGSPHVPRRRPAPCMPVLHRGSTRAVRGPLQRLLPPPVIFDTATSKTASEG